MGKVVGTDPLTQNTTTYLVVGGSPISATAADPEVIANESAELVEVTSGARQT